MKIFAVRVGKKYDQRYETYLKEKLKNVGELSFLNEEKEGFLLQWNKLHFFNLDLKEQVCVIDIDVELINEYEKLFEYPIEKGEFLSIRSWWEDDGSCELNGGFYKFYPEDTKYIYEKFKADKKYWENYFIEKGLKPGPINGEENFVDMAVRERMNLKFIPDQWVSRMIQNPSKDWLLNINKKYPGQYMYIGGFNKDIKLLHYTKNNNFSIKDLQ